MLNKQSVYTYALTLFFYLMLFVLNEDTNQSQSRGFSSQMLALLSKPILDVVVLHSNTGHIHFVSHNVSDALPSVGFTVGGNILSNICPDFEKQFRDMLFGISGLSGTPSPVILTTKYTAKGGGDCWLQFTTTSIRTKEGGVIELHSTVRNVTAFMQLAGEVGDFEDRSTSTQILSKVGGWTYLPEENQIIFSEELKRIYDFDPHEAITTETTDSLFQGEDKNQLRDLLTHVLQDGKQRMIDVEAVSKKGRHLYLRIIISAGTDVLRRTRIYGATQDITEHVQKQHELEQTVKELVAYQSRLDEFGDIVSHRLKLVSANLSGLASLLAKRTSQAEQDQILDSVYDTAMGLEHAISEFAEILQVQLCRSPEFGEIYLSDVIVRTKARTARMLRESNTHVVADDSCRVNLTYPVVYLETVLRQLFTILVHKRDPAKQCTMTLNCEKRDKHTILTIHASNSELDTGMFSQSMNSNMYGSTRLGTSDQLEPFTIRTVLEITGGSIAAARQADGSTTITVDLGDRSNTSSYKYFEMNASS